MNMLSKIAVLAAIAPLAGFADESDPNTITSANTFGVMKVVARQQIVALPVPFGNASASYVNGTGNVASDADINLPYMLQMSSLPAGTKAYIYKGTTPEGTQSEVYDIYVLRENEGSYEWEAQVSTEVGENSSTDVSSTTATKKTLPTGRGFFLEFPESIGENGQTVYLYGQQLTGDRPATTVEANKTALVCPPQTDCTFNCTVTVANPTATMLENNKIKTQGDSITVVDGVTSDAVPKTYYYIDGAWKYYSNSLKDIKAPWKVQESVVVPAGCAMWYTNKGEAIKTITWTAVAQQ